MVPLEAQRALRGFLVFGLEFFLAYTAHRAHPVSGEVFECSSGSYSIVGISGCGIIFIAAYLANIFLHISLFYIIGTKIAKFFLIFFVIYQKMHIFAIPNRKLRFPKGRTTLR